MLRPPNCGVGSRTGWEGEDRMVRGEPRSERIAVSFTDAKYDALAAVAGLRNFSGPSLAGERFER